MRKKTEKAVITFQTTTQSIATEKACIQAGIEGRLIPLPPEISAGCGFAWICEPGNADTVEQLLSEQGIGYSSIVIMMV